MLKIIANDDFNTRFQVLEIFKYRNSFMAIKRPNFNLYFLFDQHIDKEKWPKGSFLYLSFPYKI